MSSEYSFSVDTFSVETPDAQKQSTSGGYSAVEDASGRRRPAAVRLLSEDETLNSRKRARLNANTHEAVRNICIAQWAINKHLDYVSRFRFRATTNDEGYNREMQAFIAERSKKKNFDLAGRHSRERASRLTEAHAVMQGDAAWLKHGGRGPNRGKVELIEGDLIRHKELKLPQKEQEAWVNGVRVDRGTKRAIEYAIANRARRGYKKGRRVGARNLLTRGYFTRFDQFRGVSPFACALNTLRDTDESFDHARAKIKLAQMLGIASTRSSDGPLGDYLATELQKEGEADPEGDEARYDINLRDSMWAIDLERGDGIELIESKTPATETTAFLKLMVHVAIRSLDLPYSFWDESFTNFYGQRGSFLSYIQSCDVKRTDNQELLGAWDQWEFGLAIAAGEFDLPRGKDFSFIQSKWIPIGQPWWDPNKEIASQLSAIGGGLQSPQDICHATNSDFEENVDQIARALEYARDRGVTLSFDVNAAHQAAIDEMNSEEDRKAEKEKSGETDED